VKSTYDYLDISAINCDFVKGPRRKDKISVTCIASGSEGATVTLYKKEKGDNINDKTELLEKLATRKPICDTNKCQVAGDVIIIALARIPDTPVSRIGEDGFIMPRTQQNLQIIKEGVPTWSGMITKSVNDTSASLK